MKLSLHSHKTALVTLVAIASLIACLAFSVARLFDVERELRNEDTYTNLWQTSQAQFEATLLSESLARMAAGETFPSPEQEPGFRLAILISRVAVLLEGRQGHDIQTTGLMGDLKHA
jgi:hypothetical protein